MSILVPERSVAKIYSKKSSKLGMTGGPEAGSRLFDFLLLLLTFFVVVVVLVEVSLVTAWRLGRLWSPPGAVPSRLCLGFP